MSETHDEYIRIRDAAHRMAKRLGCVFIEDAEKVKVFLATRKS